MDTYNFLTIVFTITWIDRIHHIRAVQSQAITQRQHLQTIEVSGVLEDQIYKDALDLSEVLEDKINKDSEKKIVDQSYTDILHDAINLDQLTRNYKREVFNKYFMALLGTEYINDLFNSVKHPSAWCKKYISHVSENMVKSSIFDTNSLKSYDIAFLEQICRVYTCMILNINGLNASTTIHEISFLTKQKVEIKESYGKDSEASTIIDEISGLTKNIVRNKISYPKTKKEIFEKLYLDWVEFDMHLEHIYPDANKDSSLDDIEKVRFFLRNITREYYYFVHDNIVEYRRDNISKHEQLKLKMGSNWTKDKTITIGYKVNSKTKKKIFAFKPVGQFCEESAVSILNKTYESVVMGIGKP